jgi:hypothetical protein
MNALPIIPKKTFEVKSKYLPKGKILLTPFTVGLEDILIQVKDAEDEREKMQAIKQIVQACCQTPNVDVDSLPLFLIEEIFLRLRQNSVGEIIEQQYLCTNDIVNTTDEGDVTVKCNNTMPVNIDIREFKIVEEAEHTNTIIVSDPIGIKFRYPSIAVLESADADTSDEIETIISCIESIFDAENVYNADEYTRDQLRDFWNQLTLMQKKEVYDKFFSTMPHLHYEQKLTCSKCGHVHEIEFNSVQEVFQ